MDTTTSDNKNQPDNQGKNNLAIRFVGLLILFGLIAIFVYSLTPMFYVDQGGKHPTNYNLNLVVSFLGICTLIAGSALTAGCLTGFIFAIPKSISTSPTNQVRTKQGYISNDNLVQVSDWLTKIIVGVSLTQLVNVPGYVKKLGNYLGPAIGGGDIGKIASISIVVYFLICGFLLAYLWTRLYFANMLEDANQEDM
jgi:hypothetical protein